MNEPSPTGLKPTLRQTMIVILWAALLSFATIRETGRWQRAGVSVQWLCVFVPMMVAVGPVPLLALLLHLLDRPGRMSTWYFTECKIIALLLTGFALCLHEPLSYALTGGSTKLFPVGTFAVLLSFWLSLKHWKIAFPRNCPSCGLRSVIPTTTLQHGEHGWCARCGADCEREKLEPWRLAESRPVMAEPVS